MKKLILVLFTVLLVSCCNNQQEDNIQGDKDYITATRYKIVGSRYERTVEKFTIEGHEYLLFSSKLANPPTVIHNENCPCKNK